MSNVPQGLYAVALVMLMDQQKVSHFKFDMGELKPEQWRGMAIEFEVDGGKVTVWNGRCECPECVAKVGSRTQ